MRQENEGEFPRPKLFWPSYLAAAFSLAIVLGFATWATAKEADPYSQLGFVTPNNVTVVPKGPRGIMKDIPAIKRALEADVRRVEA